MSNINVSLIVPIYNAEHSLEKCLSSLVNLKFEFYNIILVNDGSTDNSEKICLKYKKKYRNIEYFFKKNGGVSSARNFGIKKATGKYIGFVDSDDYVSETYLSDLYDETVDMSIGSCYDVDIKGKVLKLSNVYKSGKFSKKDINYIRLFESGLLGTCWGKLFSKRVIDNVKFDEDLYVGEDGLFVNDCYCRSSVINLVEKANYFYVKGNMNSLSNCKSPLDLLDMKMYANDRIVEILKKDNQIDSESIKFKKNIGYRNYANCFTYVLFKKTCSFVEKVRILKYLYQKSYFSYFSSNIDDIMIYESPKYRMLIKERRPVFLLIYVELAKMKRRIFYGKK